MSAQPQRSVLGHLQARLAGFLGVQTLLAVGGAAVAFALLAVALDAVWILPRSAREAAPYALAAVVGVIVFLFLLRLRALRQRRVARAFERNDPALGTSMTNAVQLANMQADTPVTEWLRQQAVARGRLQARGRATWPVVRRTVLALAAVLLLVVAVGAVSRLAFPEVYAMVLPRFQDPAGDHPPYSRLRFSLEPSASRVLYGGQCEIRARVTGGAVKKLFLLSRGERTGATARTILFRAPDGSYFQTLTNLREETAYCVTDGRARSRWQRIDIRYTPRIAHVSARMVYPKYTGLAEKTVELFKGETGGGGETLRLPKGSQIHLRVASNRPLREGRLTLSPLAGGAEKNVTLAPDPQAAQVVAARIAVTESLGFSLSLVDAQGLASADTRSGRITILPDRPPRIVVLEPGRHAVATPTVPVPVAVEAEDDYAVADVLWFRALNRSTERSVSLPLKADRGPTRAQAFGRFDMADLGVRPGDTIEYFFEAVDNDPDGPNVTTSRIYSLRIISDEQYKEILRRRAAQDALFEAYYALTSHLGRIAERARSLQEKRRRLTKDDAALAPEERRKLMKEADRVSDETARYLEHLAKALSRPALFDIEPELRERLARQGMELKRLRKAFETLRKQAEAGGDLEPFGAPEMDRFTGSLADLAKRQAQEVGEPVRQIEQVTRLLQKASQFGRLAQQQTQLARLLRRFRDRDDTLSRIEQMELQELAASERKIRDALKGLLDALPDLLKELPKDEKYDDLRKSVQAFLDKADKADIPERLDEAVEALGALDGPGGYPPAQAAADLMMQLVQSMDGAAMMGEGKQCLVFQPSIGQSLGNTLEQLMSALNARGYQSGSAGYGLMGEDMGLYGPNMELAGAQGRGRGDAAGGSGETRHDRIAADADDPDLPQPATAGRVRLQRDAKFPLRYRNLVGEYFRRVAESQE